MGYHQHFSHAPRAVEYYPTGLLLDHRSVFHRHWVALGKWLPFNTVTSKDLIGPVADASCSVVAKGLSMPGTSKTEGSHSALVRCLRPVAH